MKIIIKKIALLLLFTFNLLSANENRLLFFGNCIACHGEFGQKSAPHLLEVKGYYLMKYPEKKDFVKHLSEWVASPNREKALLLDEIEKYQLMPYLAIDLETLQKIATYMYDNNDFGGLK